MRTDLFGRKLEDVLVTDFFGSVRNIEFLNRTATGSEWEGTPTGSEKEEETGTATDHTHASNVDVFPDARYLMPHDSLVRDSIILWNFPTNLLFLQALPVEDLRTKGTKVKGSVLVSVAVGISLTVVTMITTLGFCHVMVKQLAY